MKVDAAEAVYNQDFDRYGNSCLSGVKVWIDGNGHYFPCDSYTVCKPDSIEKDALFRGRREILDILNKAYHNMAVSERRKYFGAAGDYIVDLMSLPQDMLVDGFKAWEKDKAEEEKKIHIRDEVVNAVGNKFVVTVPPHLESNSVLYFSGIAKDGTVYKDQPVATYKKTGLHVDDLDSYLGV